MLYKLKVLSRYINLGRKLVHEANTEILVNAEERRFLLADAPGCFKEITDPPRDKMLKRPRRSKAVKED